MDSRAAVEIGNCPRYQNGTRSQFKFSPKKQQLPGYHEFSITAGEHIQKKRMDLGLLQREVAEIIDVTVSSIYNREHGVEPELQYNPSIIKFLGYIPFNCPDDTVGRLA